MKNNIIFLVIAFLAVSAVPADAFEFSGAGGFSFGMYSPDLDFLSKKIDQVTPGFKLSDDPIISWGGFGYALVSKQVRIGGYGFGGTQTSSSTFQTTNNVTIAQDVTFDYGLGAFYLEYILPKPHKRIESTLNLGIGGMGCQIRITQLGGVLSWDEMTGGLDPNNPPEVFQVSFSNSGFMLNPGIGVKYYVLPWMAIEGNVSYIVSFLRDWNFNNNVVRDMPDVNLNAPQFGLRFIFGG